MERTIRWGIMGTGSIARNFAEDLRLVEGAELLAVGSRQQSTAEAFAGRHGISRRYGSYEALVADRELDVIYVATPHPQHLPCTLLALEAGKAVLCEKPLGVNGDQVSRMIATARRCRRFCMEAMWTRFQPLHVRLRELLGQGIIGKLHLLTADFGFGSTYNAESRLFDPAMAGGALLDVGVYPIALAQQLFGPPARIASQAYLGCTGVDERAAMVFAYSGEPLALLWCAIATGTPQEALLCGTGGRIRIHRPWWRATTMTITRPDRQDQVIELPLTGHGMVYEAQEVVRCLRRDKLESDVMGLDESLGIARTMDELRGQWGLRYPFE